MFRPLLKRRREFVKDAGPPDHRFGLNSSMNPAATHWMPLPT